MYDLSGLHAGFVRDWSAVVPRRRIRSPYAQITAKNGQRPCMAALVTIIIDALLVDFRKSADKKNLGKAQIKMRYSTRVCM